MIADLVRDPSALSGRFDVCILGAGVAGITIARRLAARGRRVCLIEAGGRDATPQSQELYRGQNAGVENLPLHETRIRAFGGSSHHWGGWCRPRDAYDIERTDLTFDGGWPISPADLAPHFEDALQILRVTSAAGAEVELSKSEGQLKALRMFFSVPPANFRDLYFEEVSASERIVLALNAPAISLEYDPQSGTAMGVVVRDANSLRTLRCTAKQYVLALGTIENVRLLLIANARYGNRVGNAGGALGRYYLQHLHQIIGEFVLLADSGQSATFQQTPAFFAATRPLLERSRTGNFRLYSVGIACGGITDELRQLIGASCTAVAAGGQLSVTAEQAPNSTSQITLLSERDPLGLPRVKLDWRLADGDIRTMREAATIFGSYLVRAGLGRLKVHPAVLAGNNPVTGWVKLPGAPGAAGHQMGGARMSHRAQDGVVDRDCRVWGTTNLHVAGSAVFRTGGHATPTLTIVQLALRLAAALDRSLASD